MGVVGGVGLEVQVQVQVQVGDERLNGSGRGKARQGRKDTG